jgi:GAF domain-containing protein/HAMP domain-containing protein
MSNRRESQNDINIQNERLARVFYTNGRYYPHFLGVTGIGFFAIYVLNRSGILGQSSPQLIYIGVITLLLALTQFFLLALARRNRGITANLWGSAAVGIFAILLTYFWQGIFLLSVLVALVTPITALRAGVPRRSLPIFLLIVIASVAGIVYSETNSAFDRLQNSTPAAIASFAFLVATGLLLVTITIISENKNFKSLQNLLLTSFIVIVTIPTVMVAVLSAVGAFTNSQTQTFSTLKAISNLKENQISTLVEDFQNDTQKLQNDSGFALNALKVLTARDVDPLLAENSKRLVRFSMDNLLGSEEEEYSEMMILNTQGEVVISTLPQNEGTNFENQLFFRQGTLKFFIGFTEIPSFGNENLIVATPLFDTDGRVIRGVLALRSDASSIKGIMENTPGFESAETYLVDRNYQPVTRTRTSADLVNTQAALEAILNNISNGQDIYENYENQPVLGYYKWFETMQVAMIAEVPLNFVVANSARALAGSAVLALFVISISIAAVAISARSIVHPITVLAQTTESFAAGKLSARALVDRADEIGALARSYNQMATQLQEVIGRLEQRVNDRTRELENQTLRLRVAAEIARDAASARELGELLARSAELILNRFNFYHTGIFLLDNNKEYAVLVASPTEAGKQMLANNHKLRVGEAEIIGRVAATGEPRITLDTSADAAHFNNPYLPDTRSEMALPLQADNKVIGVLDIQSDQPQAFNEDDIAIMQTMADQLATAIERTRLLQEVERSLTELEGAYGQYTRENWKRLADNTQAGNKGYRFDNIRLQSITELPELGKNALDTGMTISSNGQNVDRQTSVAIPVKLRGQTIGVISLKLKEEYGEDTISTIELASERLASALESARLYEEARLRADREQSISQVTTAISASTNYEEILQTTVREIGTTLKDAEVTIQIIGDLKDGKQAG